MLHYLGGLRRLGVPEAYGMVAIEAMACGTPVVALANGALPELVEPHLTGFVANDALGLPDLVTPTETLERRAVRQPALDRFSIAATGKRYVELYAEISPVLRRGHLRRRRTKTEHWPEERRWST